MIETKNNLMDINADINILGGLPDFNLIKFFLDQSTQSAEKKEKYHSFTAIKTEKSVQRFERAIKRTLLRFDNRKSALLVTSLLNNESISPDSLWMLFWNSSANNDLLHYLNAQVYFPAFYSGRLIIKKEEVGACIKELKESQALVQSWTIVTIDTVARKYLTLLKKFNLMEGTLDKRILHPYLNDKMFVLFIYWLTAIEAKPNLLESDWLLYGFCESTVFMERVLQKKFSKYFELTYTGDKLKIETSIPYENIYDALK